MRSRLGYILRGREFRLLHREGLFADQFQGSAIPDDSRN